MLCLLSMIDQPCVFLNMNVPTKLDIDFYENRIHVSPPTTTKKGFIQDSNGEITGGMNSKNGLQDTSKDDGEHEDDANPQRDGSRNIHLKKMDFTLPICSSMAKLFLDARKNFVGI